MTEGHDRKTRMMPGAYNNENGEINRSETFQHLQTTFTSSQRARPPAMEFPGDTEDTRVPLRANKIHRRESKGGLRGMFTRTKADKNIILPVLEESKNVTAARTLTRSNSLNKSSTLSDPTPLSPSTPKPASTPSRLNFRAKSVKHKKPVPNQDSKPSMKTPPKPSTRSTATWDPPPLFQAYPQAIKHATLLASTLSADSIIQISNHKRMNGMGDDFVQNPLDKSAAQTPPVKKAEKAKSKHRRQLSGSISKADWTQKIFVLVTSGYLLQYSGEGSFDRLPEKMMQLGKDSVAFASDVIPGKHWVLQISQSINADGTPTADSRSLLSRLAFRGADYRRTATSLLLVLNNAEDMDSWIAVVRREIEALGGKKHVSETGKFTTEDKVRQLKAQPSHRYLIQRGQDQLLIPTSPTSPSLDPARAKYDDQIYTPVSPTSPSFAPTWTKGENLRGESVETTSSIARSLSIIRPSTGHQSVTNSFLSHDGQKLDSLRESANRLSFMSSGQRTLVTSHSSSATSSPVRDSYPSFDESPQQISMEDARPRPNTAAINERRRSIQTVRSQAVDAPTHTKNYRHSTLVMPTRPSTSHTSTPNFSTPRRLSRVLIPEPPAIPSIVTTALNPSFPRDSILKGARKGPPVPLGIIRPLSSVNDPPKVSQTAPPILTSDGSSFGVQQVKASVVSVPPRLPSTLDPVSLVDLPQRMSSLMPLGLGETAHLDFQFPKRHSSMRTLGDSIDPEPKEPVRTAPLPPNALATPLPVSPQFPDEGTKLAVSEDSEVQKDIVSPLSCHVNTNRNPQQPTGLHIQPTSLDFAAPLICRSSQKRLHTSSSQHSSSIDPFTGSSSLGATSPASVTVTSPSFQRLKIRSHPKAVGNRKSMPALASGPPPAPPPSCALPPLPPISAGLRSPVGNRNSVRV